MDLRTVRIAVVGDSGVGKSCLVHYLCHKTVLTHPKWTIGCTTEVLLYQDETFIEFVDIGGNPRYELSRSAYYDELHGIIFVYDMSNIRSYNNLKKWIAELNQAQKYRPNVAAINVDRVGALPTLVIGNKQDLVQTQRVAPLRDLKMESIEASAVQGRIDQNRFHLFLDRVIATAFAAAPSAHRSRVPVTSPSSSMSRGWW
ncbi:unnamed protein product [Aphanomyces euteiches]|uniref:Uncharacterized protein n=1 Tax=Aphanomyces euteiches TaxID=100861 RepID=A0A6G0X246_9STRA|nr:hypothetical protein Ae201684_009479 [Aphanomyces euteiches]KAH9070143.1 hypothetical protein Ae201684P_002513 [Aphanomyces euteiches]KAH9096823.1 hypothetical protein LEN26_017285 [Aphanomyces euteiches]KAH9128081.1 hypothetical protein AeMF1_001696 [Aphanomyces euteiches]KAH9136211.1 hypothetical protein AeRB84_018542 [Aphanomyces euteiches]